MDSANKSPGVRLRAMVTLMLISLTVMLAAILTLYLAPIEFAPLAAASLYAVLWVYERRLGVVSPITRIMTAFHLLFAFVVHHAEDPSWIAWYSPVVYWTLAALIFALLLAGRPFTTLYAEDFGFPPLHRALSAMWAALHFAAGLSAVVLSPHPAFLYCPLGLMVLGVFGTVWLNFVSMGPACGRRPRFEMEGYSFREATSRSDRETFYRVIADAFRPDAQSALGMRRKVDTTAIVDDHRAISDAWRDKFLPFLAFVGDRPVGGICIFFDHRRRGLPIEEIAHVDLGPWRRLGPVAEVGRLGVLRRHRISPALLRGLFKCVIEAAAERRIHFVFNDSFDFQARMYEKLGFRPIRDASCVSGTEHSTSYGIKVLPMMMDLAAVVRMDAPSGIAADMEDVLAPYVMERYFKHLVVREMASAFRLPRPGPKEIRNAKA